MRRALGGRDSAGRQGLSRETRAKAALGLEAREQGDSRRGREREQAAARTEGKEGGFESSRDVVFRARAAARLQARRGTRAAIPHLSASRLAAHRPALGPAADEVPRSQSTGCRSAAGLASARAEGVVDWISCEILGLHPARRRRRRRGSPVVPSLSVAVPLHPLPERSLRELGLHEKMTVCLDRARFAVPGGRLA